MAILEVHPHFEGQRAGAHRDRGNTYTLVWTVLTSGRAVKAREVRLAPGIPRIGDRHPDDSSSRVVSVEPELQDNSDSFWHVTVDYEPPESGSIDQSNPPPDTDPPPFDPGIPRITVETVPRSVPMEKDAYGRALVNSAGTRYVNVPEVEKSLIHMTVNGRCRFDLWRPYFSRFWKDRVNSSEFLFFDPGTVRIIGLRQATEDLRFRDAGGNEVLRTVWSLGVELLIDDLWDVDVLDQGTYKNPNGVTNILMARQFGGNTISPGLGAQPIGVTYANLEKITDSGGEEVVEPVLLDGAGNPLESGEEPVFTRWAGYKQADLNELFQLIQFPTDYDGYRIEIINEQQ